MNTSTPIIEARDLTVGYGSYVVQKDLNFTINRQDVFIIMGPSGCGKSTLLRQLKTVLAPIGKSEGEIFYRGMPLSGIDHRTGDRTFGPGPKASAKNFSAAWACSSRAALCGAP